MTESFSQFITEEPKEQKYRFLNLIHDIPDDPNKTGDALVPQAKKMGIDCYQLKVADGYFSVNKKGNLVAHNYHVNVDPAKVQSKTVEHDEKGWEVDPENTICFLRGANRIVSLSVALQCRARHSEDRFCVPA